MSKIMDALKKTSAERQNHEALGFHPIGSAASHAATISHAMAGVSGAGYSKKPETFIGRSQAAENLLTGNRKWQGPSLQNILLALVAVIGLASLMLSMRTLNEVRKTNDSSLEFEHGIALQEKKMNALEKAFLETQSQAQGQVGDLKEKLNTAAVSIKKNDEKIAELTAENAQLKSSIADVKWTAQSLTEKFISVSAQVNTLKESK